MWPFASRHIFVINSVIIKHNLSETRNYHKAVFITAAPTQPTVTEATDVGTLTVAVAVPAVLVITVIIIIVVVYFVRRRLRPQR